MRFLTVCILIWTVSLVAMAWLIVTAPFVRRYSTRTPNWRSPVSDPTPQRRCLAWTIDGEHHAILYAAGDEAAVMELMGERAQRDEPGYDFGVVAHLGEVIGRSVAADAKGAIEAVNQGR